MQPGRGRAVTAPAHPPSAFWTNSILPWRNGCSSSAPFCENRPASEHSCPTVVEFGPGTGAFTRLILERIGKQTAFLALELDEKHARGLRQHFPRLNVYHDSAERIQKYLAQHRRSKADYIISGLPWANMAVKVQEHILNAVVASLAPDGMFTTFSYVHACWLPRARRFRDRLENYFAEVKTSRTVWRNVPPAFVFRCRSAAGNGVSRLIP